MWDKQTNQQAYWVNFIRGSTCLGVKVKARHKSLCLSPRFFSSFIYIFDIRGLKCVKKKLIAYESEYKSRWRDRTLDESFFWKLIRFMTNFTRKWYLKIWIYDFSFRKIIFWISTELVLSNWMYLLICALSNWTYPAT